MLWIVKWMVRLILKNPWFVQLAPRIFFVSFRLGEIYAYAGQFSVAYEAYIRAIRAKPYKRDGYEQASRAAQAANKREQWVQFLYEMKERADARAVPLLYIAWDDSTLSPSERLSLLNEAFVRAPHDPVVIETVVKEYIAQQRSGDLVEHPVMESIDRLKAKTCEKLLDLTLMKEGEAAYIRISEKMAMCGEDKITAVWQGAVLSDDERDRERPEAVKERLKRRYFSGDVTDEQLVQLSKSDRELAPFCLMLLYRKGVLLNDGDTLHHCAERLLAFQSPHTLKGLDLYTLGNRLMAHRRYEQAVALFRLLLETGKRRGDVLGKLTACYRALGRLSEALDCAEAESRLNRYVHVTEKVAIVKAERDLPERLSREQAQAQDKGRVRLRGLVVENGGKPAVLHVLNNSFPYSLNGYAVRSKYIVENQAVLGFKPSVVTRLGFPYVRAGSGITEEVVEGIRYFRLTDDIYSPSKQPLDRYLAKYRHTIKQVVPKVQPQLVHAASNFYNGYPAMGAARAYGLPFIYEVRGFWEMSRGAFIKGYAQSEKFRVHHEMEFQVIQEADHVVAISESLKRYMVDAGIAPHKITVVPNAVDVRFFSPQAKDEQLIRQYGLKDKTVVGFIGSVTPYEGLDNLLRAVAVLDRADVMVCIVGSGSALQALKRLAHTLNIADRVIFAGRVPFSAVKRYYSVIDIFPFPRIRSRVSELVTPLKPFEAMAMERAVLVSDVGALQEMVIDGETGLYFNSEDARDLADKLEALITDREKRHYLASNGRKWVSEKRDWRVVSRQYERIYDQLT